MACPLFEMPARIKRRTVGKLLVKLTFALTDRAQNNDLRYREKIAFTAMRLR